MKIIAAIFTCLGIINTVPQRLLSFQQLYKISQYYYCYITGKGSAFVAKARLTSYTIHSTVPLYIML